MPVLAAGAGELGEGGGWEWSPGTGHCVGMSSTDSPSNMQHAHYGRVEVGGGMPGPGACRAGVGRPFPLTTPSLSASLTPVAGKTPTDCAPSRHTHIQKHGHTSPVISAALIASFWPTAFQTNYRLCAHYSDCKLMGLEGRSGVCDFT